MTEDFTTEDFALRLGIIKRKLSLEWLVAQFHHRRYGYTPREIQDVYFGRSTGAAAKPIIKQAMTIIDEYDRWLAGVSA